MRRADRVLENDPALSLQRSVDLRPGVRVDRDENLDRSGISARLDGAVVDVGDPGRQLIRRPEGEVHAVRDRPGEAKHPSLEAGQEHRHVAWRRMLEPEPANGHGFSGPVDPLAPADGAEDLHVLAHRLQRRLEVAVVPVLDDAVTPGSKPGEDTPGSERLERREAHRREDGGPVVDRDDPRAEADAVRRARDRAENGEGVGARDLPHGDSVEPLLVAEARQLT